MWLASLPSLFQLTFFYAPGIPSLLACLLLNWQFLHSCFPWRSPFFLLLLPRVLAVPNLLAYAGDLAFAYIPPVDDDISAAVVPTAGILHCYHPCVVPSVLAVAGMLLLAFLSVTVALLACRLSTCLHIQLTCLLARLGNKL